MAQARGKGYHHLKIRGLGFFLDYNFYIFCIDLDVFDVLIYYLECQLNATF